MLDSTTSPTTASTTFTAASTTFDTAALAAGAAVLAAVTGPSPAAPASVILLQSQQRSQLANSAQQDPTYLTEPEAVLDVAMGQPAEPPSASANDDSQIAEYPQALSSETVRDTYAAAAAEVDPAAAELAEISSLGESEEEHSVSVPSAVAIIDHASAQSKDGVSVATHVRIHASDALDGVDVVKEVPAVAAGERQGVATGGGHLAARAETELTTAAEVQHEATASLESEQVLEDEFQNKSVVDEDPGDGAEQQVGAGGSASFAERVPVASEGSLLALPGSKAESNVERVFPAAKAVTEIDTTEKCVTNLGMQDGVTGLTLDQQSIGSSDNGTQQQTPPSDLLGATNAEAAAEASETAEAPAPSSSRARRAVVAPKRLIASVPTTWPDSSPVRVRQVAADDQMPAARRPGIATPSPSARQQQRPRAAQMSQLPPPGAWRRDPEVQGAQRQAEEELHRRIAAGELKGAVAAPGCHPFAIAGDFQPVPFVPSHLRPIRVVMVSDFFSRCC